MLNGIFDKIVQIRRTMAYRCDPDCHTSECYYNIPIQICNSCVAFNVDMQLASADVSPPFLCKYCKITSAEIYISLFPTLEYRLVPWNLTRPTSSCYFRNTALVIAQDSFLVMARRPSGCNIAQLKYQVWSSLSPHRHGNTTEYWKIRKSGSAITWRQRCDKP